MKVTIVNNCVLSIVLQAETEIEQITLQQLAKGEVTFQVHEKLQIIDKVIPNAAIITPKVSDKQETTN